MDINKLTIGEVALIEEMAGLPIAALGDPEKPKGKLMVALAYVINKRNDPKYTKFQAEQLTMDEITALIGTTEDENPELGK